MRRRGWTKRTMCNGPRAKPYRRLYNSRVTYLALCFLAATLNSAAGEGRAFDCLLEPRLRIKLATPVAGVLREVTVDRGDIIRKGQVVARLESGVEQAMLDLAEARAQSDAMVKAREARLAYLTKKRDRILGLVGKGAASPASLDEVESDFGVASHELREAQANMQIAQLDVVRAAQVVK